MSDLTEWGTNGHIGEADPVLERIRDMYTCVDPVPRSLYTRVRFVLDLDGVERELARVCAGLDLEVAVRGLGDARTITFECDTLTIAVTITATGVDRNRLDGWIAPPAGLPVEIRSKKSRKQTSSDDGGRFVFDDVPAGEMQLAVLPVPGSPVELVHPVVTQSIVL